MDNYKDFDTKSLTSSHGQVPNLTGVGDSHFLLADSDASQMSKPSYLQDKFKQERKIRRKQREQTKGPSIPVTRAPIPQIFTHAAQRNAYFTCHNASEMLKIRGFPAKTYPPIESPEGSDDSD